MQDDQAFPVALWLKQEALIHGGVFISRSGRAVYYVTSDYTTAQCKPHGGVKSDPAITVVTGPSVGDICGIPACFSYDLTPYNSLLGFDDLFGHF